MIHPPPAGMPAFDPNLGRALHFNPTDLLMNHDGWLSPAQAQRLFLMVLWRDARGLVGWQVLSTLLGAAILFTGNTLLCCGWWLVLWLLPALGLLSKGLGLMRMVERDLRDRRVDSLRGPVKLLAGGPKDALLVGEHAFRVGGRAQRAFVARRVYTVYFTPHTGVVLSAEGAGHPTSEGQRHGPT